VTSEDINADVLIVGSGPLGATFARILALGGRQVCMIESGAQHSRLPGEHLKNAFVYQRDLDRFTPIVQGLLNPVSIPYTPGSPTVLDPVSFRPASGSVRSGHNPKQQADRNLPGAAVSYGVGGMFTHWTNNTPRQHPTLERPDFFSDDQWKALYGIAEKLLNTRLDVFDQSRRHAAVINALRCHYGSRLVHPYEVQSLPTAGERRKDNDEFVHFTGVDTVLGPLLNHPDWAAAGKFKILAHHRCKELVHQDGKVTHAIVEDLMRWRRFNIRANTFIITGGAVLTPQLLWASGIRPDALGRYLHEHPMAFTQIVLRKEIVNSIKEALSPAQAQELLAAKDPVPIPVHDPPPMAWIPVSQNRPWHCQVHRDSFAYGALPPDIDDRLVVDLRWFGMVDPAQTNRITFEDSVHDKFGMPQPTFDFTLSGDDRRRADEMMSDLVEAAQVLGGFLPGSEPRFLPPGSSLHLQGTTRMGPSDDHSSVVDLSSRVWDFENLFLGGNGLLPTRNACNPTLTSMALAVQSAADILGRDPASIDIEVR